VFKNPPRTLFQRGFRGFFDKRESPESLPLEKGDLEGFKKSKKIIYTFLPF